MNFKVGNMYRYRYKTLSEQVEYNDVMCHVVVSFQIDMR